MTRIQALTSVAFGAMIASASPALAQANASAQPAPDAQPAPADAQPEGANAPTDAASEAGLGDIVVTARKVSENLQRAPASIVAVTGEELQARGITQPQDLEKILPSANLRRQGPITQIFIRGIGTRSDLPNFAAASAFVYNGLIVNRYGTFGLTFDLGRVESIAGPQGTLYGGNAAGGAINLFSRLPENNFSGSASLEVGTHGNVHPSVAQNLALGDDLSARVTFDYDRRDAYYSGGMSSQKNWSGRASLLYKPSADFSALLFYSHGNDDGRPVTTLVSNPLVDPDHPYRLPTADRFGNPINGSLTRQDNHNDVIGANINFNLGDNSFTYIPGYVDFTADYDYYSGLAGNRLQVYDRERQHSEELRWNRTVGPVKMTAGLFYLRNLTDFNDSLNRPTAKGVFARTVLNVTDQVNETYAAYAQAVLSATDRLRFTVGGRITHDKIEATGVGGAGVRIAFDRGHSHLDYKLGVDFDAAERVLVYANLQSGYIPFGYNPDVAPTATNPQNPLVPESKLTAWSGGFKSRFLDNRVELNVEGYYYTYRNFQAIAFVNATGLSTVLAAKKSTILGMDISLRARLGDNTDLNIGTVLQRARYDQFAGPGYSYSGNQMINAPDVNIQAGLSHTFHFTNEGRAVARVDGHYEDGHFSNFNNFPTTHQDAYAKVDASITYTSPNDRWDVGVFVRNLTNKPVFTTLSPGATPNLPSSGGLEAPRVFGARVAVKW